MDITSERMDITSAQYTNGIKGNQSGIIAEIDGKEMTVPLDPNNRHYAAILKWVAEGNTIQDAD